MTLQSIDARTGEPFGDTISSSSAADIDRAVQAAHAAFADWQASEGGSRAALLDALAQALEADREALVALADRETGLGLPRLTGELDRTAFQLRGFADQLLAGAATPFSEDAAVPGAPGPALLLRATSEGWVLHEANDAARALWAGGQAGQPLAGAQGCLPAAVLAVCEPWPLPSMTRVGSCARSAIWRASGFAMRRTLVSPSMTFSSAVKCGNR